MNLKKILECISLYLKSILPTLLFMALLTGAFSLVLYLQNISFDIYGYAIFFVWFIYIIYFIINYFRFYFKYRDIENLLEFLQANDILLPDYLLDNLPKSNNYFHRKYKQMFGIVCDRYNTKNVDFSSFKTESVDYYTTWVHQIKSPISVMKMILQNSDTSQSRMVEQELFKVEQYVEMALNYARLDGKVNDFVIKKCHVDEIVKRAVRKYSALLVGRKIKPEINKTDIVVISDEKWLEFMIEQIISNAVKYTMAGSISIYARGNILSISDTGIGISESDLPRIFEKGFTGFNGRENKKSTGLGLYLCRKTADKLGFKIYAKSRVGEGTTVSIDLNQIQREYE